MKVLSSSPKPYADRRRQLLESARGWQMAAQRELRRGDVMMALECEATASELIHEADTGRKELRFRFGNQPPAMRLTTTDRHCQLPPTMPTTTRTKSDYQILDEAQQSRLEAVRRHLVARGVTLRSWAISHGFNANTVRAAVAGKSFGVKCVSVLKAMKADYPQAPLPAIE